MPADAVGADFFLRGKKSNLRPPPRPLTSSDLTLASPVSNVLATRARPRDPLSESYFRRHVEPLAQAAVGEPEDETELEKDRDRLGQRQSPSSATSLPKSAADCWYLAPTHLRSSDYPVDRLDGLPVRPNEAPEGRRPGLMGGLLAGADISRAAARSGRDADADTAAPRPVRPVDYDPLAAVHFPVTLGASYRVREQIDDASGAGGRAADPTLTFSPPASGLPYPTDPWRVRTPHNAADFVPQFRSVSDHLAEAVPLAKQRQRTFLLADKAPATSSAEVFVSSPYSVDLAQLRMQRLRIEEEILLEVKRQQELERTAPPKDKWYSMRTPQFHYEARKNNLVVRGSSEDPMFDAKLFQYRQQLAEKSAEFKDTVDAYSRLRTAPPAVD